MYLVKVNDQTGINLDHVSDWQDFPEGEDPLLILTMLSASETAYGQRQPHTIKLSGPEREQALHWLAQVGVHDDWKTAYEEARDELCLLRDRLSIFEERAYLGDRDKIWEIIRSHEERIAARAARD
jgi:hypothetical protein